MVELGEGAEAGVSGVSKVHDFGDDGWDGVGVKIGVTPSFDQARDFFGVKREDLAFYDFAGGEDVGF